MNSTSILHDPSSTCEEIGFNRFETLSADPGSPEYGVLTQGYNIGLRQCQAKKLNIDEYNSGCINQYGCLSSPENKCLGKPKKLNEVMEARYAKLNAPYDPSGSEYNPPQYMMGWKDGGVNSVTGHRVTNNRATWQNEPTNNC